MSRSPRATVELHLGPAGARLTRRVGWFRPRVVASAQYRGAPLEALDEALKDERWQDARLRVVVSNRLVRYAVLPPAAVVTLAEETAIAEARFRQIHGAHPELAVRLSDPLSGRSQVAAAMTQEMIDGLRERCRGARLQLRSLEPLLAKSVAEARPQGERFCLASIEAETLLVAMHGERGWTRVAVAPTRRTAREELADRLAEMRLLAGEEDFPSTVYVHEHDCAGEDWPASVDGLAVLAVRPAKEGSHAAASH